MNARASRMCIGTEIEFSTPENPHAGELAMWGAVLVRAKDDLDLGFDPHHDKPTINRGVRARAWFNSTRTDSGSFFWICTITGLDPDAVREKLKEKL